MPCCCCCCTCLWYSLRYEQGRAGEALVLLNDSMKKWFRPDAEDNDVGDGDADNDDQEMGEGAGPAGASDVCSDDDDVRIQPSYEFRFECAKLLLELSDTTEVAIQVGTVWGLV